MNEGTKFCASISEPFIGFEGEKVLHLLEALYRINVFVILNSSQSRHDQIHKNLGINTRLKAVASKAAWVYCLERTDVVDRPIIFCHFFTKPNEGIIAHEAFHIVEYILEDVGIRHCEQTTEVYGYLLQWVVDEITEFIASNPNDPESVAANNKLIIE